MQCHCAFWVSLIQQVLMLKNLPAQCHLTKHHTEKWVHMLAFKLFFMICQVSQARDLMNYIMVPILLLYSSECVSRGHVLLTTMFRLANLQDKQMRDHIQVVRYGRGKAVSFLHAFQLYTLVVGWEITSRYYLQPGGQNRYKLIVKVMLNVRRALLVFDWWYFSINSSFRLTTPLIQELTTYKMSSNPKRWASYFSTWSLAIFFAALFVNSS